MLDLVSRNARLPDQRELAERLPPAPRKRLQFIRDKAAETHAASYDVSQREREQRALAQEAIKGYATQIGWDPTKTNPIFEPLAADDNIALRTAKLKYRDATVEAVRLAAIFQEKMAAWQPWGTLKDAAERYAEGIDGPVQVHPGVTLKLAKGQKPADVIEPLCQHIAELRADLHHVQSARYPSSETKALARAQIRTLAATGRPEFRHLIEAKGKIEWPQLHILRRDTEGVDDYDEFHSLGLMCWLFEKELIAKIDAEIAMMSDDPNALDDAQRAEKVCSIKAAILEAEYQEVAALDRSPGIAYRPDTDPRAALMLSPDMPEAKER